MSTSGDGGGGGSSGATVRHGVSYRALTRYQRLEALALVDELLLRQVVQRRIYEALKERYGLGESGARRLIREAEDAAVRAVEEQLARRRAVFVRSLQRLYERAWSEGRLGVAAQVAATQARVEGHMRAERVVVDRRGGGLAKPEGAGEAGDTAWERDAATRSPAELEHYARHGRWPEGPAAVLDVEGEPSGAAGGEGSDERAAVIPFPLARGT